MNSRNGSLLRLEDLRTYFHTEAGVVKAVDGVNLSLDAGKTLGLVGETGCGKSVTALSVLRLIPSPPGEIVGGRVLFQEQDLLQLREREMRQVRGGKISMIFQEPMTSLNPVFTIGNQIEEALRLHQNLGKRRARERAVELLTLVGIPSPQERARDYPHLLSGGMRQRVMIAMAVSCQPLLLIADEPTTALDVTIQAQILELLAGLQARFQMSILLITHDLGVIAQTADRVAVMYAGRIVEEAPVEEIFHSPLHPYTRGLLECLPAKREKGERLRVIPGQVPDLVDLGPGCAFAPRCSLVIDTCREKRPDLEAKEPEHKAACYRC